MQVLLLEPDRVYARCIKQELSKRNIDVHVATTADRAVELADKINPDIVISELSLPGHSGTEFLYEFRTYSDWRDTPLLVYSSMQLSDDVTKSKDWKLLNVGEYLYKPDVSLEKLAQVVESSVES
jgi:DNA-binding response OmpR family regulator